MWRLLFTYFAVLPSRKYTFLIILFSCTILRKDNLYRHNIMSMISNLEFSGHCSGTKIQIYSDPANWHTMGVSVSFCEFPKTRINGWTGHLNKTIWFYIEHNKCQIFQCNCKQPYSYVAPQFSAFRHGWYHMYAYILWSLGCIGCNHIDHNISFVTS